MSSYGGSVFMDRLIKPRAQINCSLCRSYHRTNQYIFALIFGSMSNLYNYYFVIELKLYFVQFAVEKLFLILIYTYVHCL